MNRLEVLELMRETGAILGHVIRETDEIVEVMTVFAGLVEGRQPEVTPEMIEAAEQVEDLHKRGTPQTWAAVFRAMWMAKRRSA